MRDVGEGDTVGGLRRGAAGMRRGSPHCLSEEYKYVPALYRVLVTDRNRHWVPQIEKSAARERDYFVVVGALHLVGEGGLLDLMRRDGYKPEILN